MMVGGSALLVLLVADIITMYISPTDSRKSPDISWDDCVYYTDSSGDATNDFSIIIHYSYGISLSELGLG